MKMKSQNGIRSFIKKKAGLLCLCLFVASLTVVFINNRYLLVDPLKEGITWEDVGRCAADGNGTIGVIDSFGSRVSIVSEDGKLIGSISSSLLDGQDLQTAGALTFSGDSVYVLDLGTSDSGNTVVSQRILQYSINGKRQGTVYEISKDASFLITDIYGKDGKCYAAAVDSACPGEAVIGEISGGQFRELHRFPSVGSDVFSVSYNPETDSTCVITYNGNLMIADGDTPRENEPLSGNVLPSRAVVNDSGYLVVLDSNNNRLFLADSAGETWDVASTYASYVSEKNESLVFADLIREEVSRYDSEDGNIQVYGGAEYTFEYRAGVMVTYLCLIFAAAYLLVQFLKLVIRVVVALRRKTWDEETCSDPDRITIKSMITTMMPTFVMCYIVAAFILSTAVWSSETGSAEDSLMDAAAASMYIAPNTVGDRFREIKSEKDYNGEAYSEIIRLYEYLSLNSTGDDRSYGYFLYGFPEDSQNVITISDALGQFRTGEIISVEEQEGVDLAEDLGTVRNGESCSRIYEYKNGMELLWAAVPVYDSAGEIVGAAIFSSNYSLLKSNIIGGILQSLEKMLVLMAGFLFLLAEIRVGRSLAGLQLERIRQGDLEHTLVESAHTIQVLSDVSKSVSVVFFTLIAADITKKSGATGAVLLALPFTIQTVSSKAAKTALVALPLGKTKKAMTYGAVIQIAGAVLGIAAVAFSGFVLLCISAAMLSVGSQICSNRASKIRKLGTKITDRYDDLESNKLTAPTIGTAIGAALRTYFGNMAIFILLIVFSVGYILVKNLFIGDCAAAEEKPDFEKAKTGIINTVRFVLRPRTLLWLLFILLPGATVLLMSSYVLPVLTSSVKASDIFIAAITVIVAFITMYVLPYVRKYLNRLSANVIYAVSMGLIGLLFLVYAKVSTLECFAVIILAVSILTAWISVSRDKLMKNEIAQSALRNVNREPVTKAAETVFYAAMPTVLSLFLQKGNGFFGLAVAAFLLLSAGIALFVFREPGDAVPS